MPDAIRLILASGSSARKTMLQAAGLSFDVIPASVDEETFKVSMTDENTGAEPADVAVALATEKALSVSKAYPDALVIGADQVLALGRRMYAKATNLSDARDTLQSLRGLTHELVSAVALAQGEGVVWQTFDSAQMTMRKFSDAYLQLYLDRTPGSVLNSVGCYELEGIGIQLFERVEGDYFTILGMPLLPLLTELRARGAVPG